MTEPVDFTGAKYVSCTKDQVFEIGDIIVFIFTKDGSETADLNSPTNLMARVENVEGRYITLRFTITPLKDGEQNEVFLDRNMTVKINGCAGISLVGPEGVSRVMVPIADVVNSEPYIIIKTMVERKRT